MVEGHIGRTLKKLECSWVDVFIQSEVYPLNRVFYEYFRNTTEFRVGSSPTPKSSKSDFMARRNLRNHPSLPLSLYFTVEVIKTQKCQVTCPRSAAN